MPKMKRSLALFILTLGVLAMPTLTRALSFEIKAQPGWVIFDPTKDGVAYRYGPSLMLNEDGSIDAWFASPGGPGTDNIHQWDWIRHKHSADGGKTWGPETIVLKASEGSRDCLSVCDPGVVKFGGHYYLGVTAVADPKGNDNEVFVARADAPAGPFEKWNGAGWGGNRPMPLVAFRQPVDVWGAGEPSFVVKDGKVFVYYSISSRDDKGQPTNQTWVATAPADDPNWPGKIAGNQLAWNREKDEDSTDVKYCDKLGRFISISSSHRLTAEAHLVYRESEDGLHWSAPAKLTENIKTWCHNAGISGTPEGHLDLTKQNYIGYAYSTEPKINWAFWYTNLHPITITPTAK